MIIVLHYKTSSVWQTKHYDSLLTTTSIHQVSLPFSFMLHHWAFLRKVTYFTTDSTSSVIWGLTFSQIISIEEIILEWNDPCRISSIGKPALFHFSVMYSNYYLVAPSITYDSRWLLTWSVAHPRGRNSNGVPNRSRPFLKALSMYVFTAETGRIYQNIIYGMQ